MRPLLALLLGPLAVSAGAAEIALREVAVPIGTLVRLADIAEITCEAAERDRLAALPIMPNPAAGVVQHVRARAIRDLLQAQGESVHRHTFTGAPMVKIGAVVEKPAAVATDPPATPRPSARRDRSTAFRSAPAPRPRRVVKRTLVNSRDRAIAKERVRRAIDGWLTSRGPRATPFGVDTLALTDDQVLKIDELGEGRLAAASVAPDTTAGTNRFRITSAAGDGSVVIEATLAPLPIRVVAIEPITRGGLITASRVRLQPLPLDVARSRAGLAALAELEAVVGKEAKRGIKPGEPLTDANTQSQILVRRGETVDVVSGGGGVTVRIQAVARGDGREGDLVQVEAYDRRERFAARVVGRRRLAIVSASASEARLAAAAAQGGSL